MRCGLAGLKVRGELMPQSFHGYVPLRYLVVRNHNKWVIQFDGEEFGPYKSKREAMLFAIDAAHKFGQQDEPTEVLLMGDAGEAKPAWTYGQPPYPPSL
jgi:hypothetical protein